MLAAAGGHVNVIKMLLENQATVNEVDKVKVGTLWRHNKETVTGGLRSQRANDFTKLLPEHRHVNNKVMCCSLEDISKKMTISSVAEVCLKVAYLDLQPHPLLVKD